MNVTVKQTVQDPPPTTPTEAEPSSAVRARPDPARSTKLRTLRAAAGTYARSRSAQVAVVAAVLATVGRLTVGHFGWLDLVLLGLVTLLVGVVEWIIHTVLLHAPEESFRTRRLQTSVSHRLHHEDPTLLRNVLLDPVQAAAFLPMIAAFTAAWTLPLILITNRLAESIIAPTGLLGPYLTALAASWWCLAHYEWVHLLVHTSYRPKSRYYKRLARNHRLHHYRNEDHWLGVTSNMGDRLLGTLPAKRSDVPLSETARTLG